MDWKNKVVLITGSSIGIGRELAAQLLKKGACVALNARNAARLSQTLQAFQEQGYEELAGIPGDVSKPEDCARLVAETLNHFGQLDVVVNNAGISAEGDVSELSSDVFRKVTEVNYLGSVYVTQQSLPHLRESRGTVFFVSSIAAFRGVPGHAVYSASKVALKTLSEALRMEEERHGVHVGIAFVGFTENDPQKAIYDKAGALIPQPSRDFVKQEPVGVVAARIIRMIERREARRIFTLLGKLNGFANRFMPAVAGQILRRSYHQRKGAG
ncbi:SDR family oxidoreductase [Phaeodactylibacter sp.]|uniref:SDR family oxidoreductase n=1 Tax=Phaeodactylibacter sp. TaxID=1940289 RepID=UPI0025F1D67C|nr:SDR family oxidoreductase [Phaeodactylibacter sp.]MCI4646714.1 SDR family oxidoreductase [Phaeodactylibacter sp.]MCI5089479.1 SDR family oxidoreductase [Phaeodactylibacter sp.]